MYEYACMYHGRGFSFLYTSYDIPSIFVLQATVLTLQGLHSLQVFEIAGLEIELNKIA